MTKGKRLVVFLDGTWMGTETDKKKSWRDVRLAPEERREKEAASTNILKMMRALKPRSTDGTHQVVFYLKGVGVDGNLWQRLLGGVAGHGVDANIMEAYQWLANNFDPECDEIFIFGFSRGAYTARSLAGLMGAVGLMNSVELRELPVAFDYYRTPKKEREKSGYDLVAQARIERNKQELGERSLVRCLGVFDTVGALGLPRTRRQAAILKVGNALNLAKVGEGEFGPEPRAKYEFHDVELGNSVGHAYHALSVDERRYSFQPTIWRKPSGWPGVELEQRWFVGDHSDIGGGHTDDGRLAAISLRWMVEKAAAVGLDFNMAYIREVTDQLMKPWHMGDVHDMYPTWKFRIAGWKKRDVRADPNHDLVIDKTVYDRRQDTGGSYWPDLP